MKQGLTFAIHPDGEAVSLGLLQKTIQDVHRLVRDVDYAVTKEKGIRRWMVEELRSSIPTITIRPLLDHSETVEAIMHGLQTVSRGSLEPPNYFTEEALEDLRRMRLLFIGRDRAKRLEFSFNGEEKAIVESDIGRKVEQILKGGYWNLGSLEGLLEALNLHGSPTFTIWDRVSKMPIRCNFPQEREWKDLTKSLLEKRVLVTGRINYFSNGSLRSITRIEGIEDASPKLDLPKATFGSIPSEEAARGSVEFLHKVRGKSW